jgi:hypothetical protein
VFKCPIKKGYRVSLKPLFVVVTVSILTTTHVVQLQELFPHQIQTICVLHCLKNVFFITSL